MFAPEEISAWSVDELRTEILQKLAASGKHLEERQHVDGFWIAQVLDVDGEVEVTETHVDRRLLLLNVFGRLWTGEVSEGSPWAPRQGPRDLTVRPVSHAGSKVADPEDLDPKEIAQLYKR